MPDPATFKPERPFYGISHPRALRFPPVLWAWRLACCRYGWHLWAEVSHGPPTAWYLHCSACELVVNVESVSTHFARSERPAWAAKVPTRPLHTRLPDGDLPGD
jgi:hypothetical protein